MAEFNPYASPQAESLPVLWAADPEEGGVWRDGSRLVMLKTAELPDKCVKSNEPAHGRQLKRKLHWHHPLIYVAVLQLMIYVILAIIFTRRATIYIGLSERWFRKRRRAILIGWVAALSGLALIAAPFIVSGNDADPYVVVGGFLVFLVGAIYGGMASRMVVAVRITKTHVWLRGIHPQYLAELPAWHGE